MIGHPHDLADVELLSTSLLVQANAAMLRCGQQADCQGVSRTTSFRRAFLVSYATRIGERLRAADHRAVHECSRSGKLVPVLAPTEPSRSPPLRTSSSRIRRHGRPTSATHAAGSRGERRQTWRASMSGMPWPRRPARGAAAELRGFRHQRCSPVANRLSRAAACPRSAATRRPRPWTSRAALGRAGRRSRARTRAEPLRRWLPRSTNGRPTARVARRR